jgi:polyisoprenoid-binding protein YceI
MVPATGNTAVARVVVRGTMRYIPTALAILALATIGAATAQLAAQDKAAAAARLEIAPGSTAGYRVNEQLARFKFPNDAVGTTDDVTGAIGIRPDGTFSPDSKLTVDLRTIESDEPKRDAFLRQNTLETAKFPLAEFVPRQHQGLAMPLPASGAAKFQLIGDMTMHGVTSQVIWNVTADLAPDRITAKATTNFPFSKFNLTIPRIFGLISVTDDIRLELDVRLRRVPSSTAE